MNIVYIHRGRNAKSIEIGKLFTSTDYNFDYRGKKLVLLLAKALITATEIPKADVYFVEGGICLHPAVFTKIIKSPKSQIILMVPEPLFHIDDMSYVKRKYLKWALSHISGIIAVSQMVAQDAKQLYNGPVFVGHHYIINHQRFINIEADHQSKKMIFVIERPIETGYIKGLDIVLETFNILKNKFTDAELLLIGSGTESLQHMPKGVQCLGFQKPEDVFPKCSVIISPARYDAFPLAIAEACCSGLIPVISSKVGSKEFIAPVKKDLIIPSLSPDKFAQKIAELWQKPIPIKKQLAKKLSANASIFTKDYCLNEFRESWNAIYKKPNN